MTQVHQPVTDWESDFDILDPGYIADPTTVWAQLRDGCPIARTDRRGPTWLPVEYDTISSIAHDIEHFSSRDIAVITPGRDIDPLATNLLEAPPITSDPPIHPWARRLLLPAFGPSAIEQQVPVAEAIANELIEGFFHQRQADVAADYAQHIPVRVIAKMIGVPQEDEATFTRWAVAVIQEGVANLDGAMDTIVEIVAYFKTRVTERRATPPDQRPEDLITLLLEAEDIEGNPLRDRHIIGSCFLLLLAGIDTTWSAIGSALLHLATHPDDQRRLREDPSLMNTAVEEVLRFYSPVTMARYVTDDIEVGSCPMRKGDKVLMNFPGGNRDPKHFDEPDQFIIDRSRNRHFAFGSGVHRCLGSNLARMEIRVAMETFLARIPPFAVTDIASVTWSGGQVRGPRRAPVSW